MQPLKYGSRGPEVTKLQQMLKDAGFFPQSQSTTEYFGPITEKALKEYQKSKGILNSVERLEEQRQAQAEQLKKQSELTAVSEPKPSHAQNATQKPIEQSKTKIARVAPSPPEKSHHRENRRQNEPSQPIINIKKAEQTFSDYLKKVEEVAKTIS